MRALLRQLQVRLQRIQDEIDEATAHIERIAAADPTCHRLRSIPGVGPLVATALIAAVGNGAHFHRSRDFSAWIGLVQTVFNGWSIELHGVPAFHCLDGIKQMPTDIDSESESDIKIGEIYEDAFYHPCLCVGIENGLLLGISLVDGSYDRCTEIHASRPRKLSVEEAWIWRTKGPPDVAIAEERRWWQ